MGNKYNKNGSLKNPQNIKNKEFLHNNNTTIKDVIKMSDYEEDMIDENNDIVYVFLPNHMLVLEDGTYLSLEKGLIFTAQLNLCDCRTNVYEVIDDMKNNLTIMCYKCKKIVKGRMNNE